MSEQKGNEDLEKMVKSMGMLLEMCFEMLLKIYGNDSLQINVEGCDNKSKRKYHCLANFTSEEHLQIKKGIQQLGPEVHKVDVFPLQVEETQDTTNTVVFVTIRNSNWDELEEKIVDVIVDIWNKKDKT